MMDECIFCKIVKGEIPCTKLGETDNLLAFLDVNPLKQGHTLVIPKKHNTNFLDFPEYLGNELLEFSQKIGQAIVTATGSEGFNFFINNGEAAGQAVFHTHFHLIPRNKGDGAFSWTKTSPAKSEELSEMQKKISQYL